MLSDLYVQIKTYLLSNTTQQIFLLITDHYFVIEFHGLEDWLLKRALETLEQKHKAEIISYDGSEGVKFFS